MSELLRYRRMSDTPVVAVQLDLDTEGFSYRKWGAMQTAQAGDWLVSNRGDVYTVERQTFERTYREVGPGLYEKATPVWARVAEQDGVIRTKEGETHYCAGDMLVFNDPQEIDGYAMSRERFDRLYEVPSKDSEE